MRTVKLGEKGIVCLLEVRKDGKLRVIAHPDAPENLDLTTPAKDGKGSEALEEMKSGLRSFQKFVPRELVRRILSSGKESALGGERRRITVFFSDIADFTRIAESLSPEALVDLLSAYLDAMTREMLAANATVDKYIGDAIMAFWGAPQDDEDQCWGACRAALANQRELKRLRGTWSDAGLPGFNARIGLHAGDAIVRNFGSEYRLDYTAIGDTVNLASRLEGLNKVYGTWIIMSETVHAEVSDRVVVRLLDRVAAKGRTGGTTIYELVGLPEDVSEDSLELIARYEAALRLYFERDFKGAVAGFREVLARVPEDGPTAVLCARSEIYLDHPPPAEWNGVYAHDTK